MFKKVLKALFIYSGISWMAFGAARNSLLLARERYPENGKGCKVEWHWVWLDTIAMYKEAWRIIRKGTSK